MHKRGKLFRAARWILILALFTVVMQVVTTLTGVNHGWVNTAVLSAVVLAIPRAVLWFQSRRARRQ